MVSLHLAERDVASGFKIYRTSAQVQAIAFLVAALEKMVQKEALRFLVFKEATCYGFASD